jgi:FkbM family methyltransferase
MLLHAADRTITPQLVHEGTWEPDEAQFLRAVITPGDVVVDIGANVGYFTLLGAHATGDAGTVIAVEPQVHNAELLRANVWRHGLVNVQILPAAAGAERGFLGLHELIPNNTGSFETRPTWGPDDAIVPVVGLDEVLEDLVVDVVKVDVQGADHEAIAGMRRALGRSPQAVVLTEFWLDGMEARGVTPVQVLASYRASQRPLSLLGPGGSTTRADDAEIIAACERSEGRFVNLVLGPLA